MKTTNLQINKKLIDKLLEDLEKDKILEESYKFIKPKYEEEIIKGSDDNAKIK